MVARRPHKSVDSKRRGRLTHTSNATRPGLNACACTAHGFALISRYLLILIALSLVTMPITEHLWTWDRFLQGGQDFELGALLVLSLLCLVLVHTKQCQQRVESSFSRWWVVAFRFMNHVSPGVCRAGEAPVFYPEPGSDPGTHRSDFPLQI